MEQGGRKVTEGWEERDRTWDGTEGKGARGGKWRGATAPNFNSWRRHC